MTALSDERLEGLRGLYRDATTIAVVGCSSDPLRAANYVPRYMRAHGYTVIPVNPRQNDLLGERCFASLREIDGKVDIVQVFRPSEEAPAIAQDAVAIGASCLWLQLGLRSDEAARIARAGGMRVVMDRCMGVVHGQLGLGYGLHLGDEWHRGLEPPTRLAGGQQLFLEVTAGPAAGRTIPTDQELVIGREGDGAGRIEDDSRLAQRHARISRDRNDQVLIEDLESEDGVYINGVRIDEQPLTIGDVIQLGEDIARTAARSVRGERVGQRRRQPARAGQRGADGWIDVRPDRQRAARRVPGIRARRLSERRQRRTGSAAGARTLLAAARGRARAGPFERREPRHLRSIDAALRSRYAALIGADADEIALTHGTADAISTVLWGLHLRRRDEILISDEEHMSLLAPLAAVSKRFGVDVRVAPLDELAGAVRARTRLVACSHVSWMTGRVADLEAIAAAGAPVLVDGAQAAGAVPVDVHAGGCDYYATSGQKWLCGPEGSGFLYVRRDRQRTLSPPWPSVLSLGEVSDMRELVFHADARRFDTASVIGSAGTWALASLEVLAEAGPEPPVETRPEARRDARASA